MLVSESAPSASEEHYHLSVLHDVADVFSGFGIVCHGSWRHIDVAVFAVCAVAAAFSAVSAVSGKDVPVVAEMEEGPEVVVTSQIHVSSASSVATVGASVWLVFGPVHVHAASSAPSGATTDFYVVNEIGFCHGYGVAKG